MGKYDPQPQSPRAAADRRAPCIANLSEISVESYDREKDGIAGRTWDLGEATGSKLLGIDVTEIPPGKKTSHLHAHSHKEEFFYVLEGKCKLKLGAEEFDVRAGDAIARPAGTGVPHMFFNPYDAPCKVMMLGVQGGQGVEDVVDWPELKRELIITADGARKVARK
ncbi:MAG: cupin domain-containing protein [Elusimicrobia bacterium]|nr:cupin domain-containing protein [Elusimicrobiota bacterium]